LHQSRGEPSFVSISEEDNGHGIAEAHQANIFNMFYRANDRKQGSELGLYILKIAVERLSLQAPWKKVPCLM
jgi:signal transduction histidine kinase